MPTAVLGGCRNYQNRLIEAKTLEGEHYEKSNFGCSAALHDRIAPGGRNYERTTTACCERSSYCGQPDVDEHLVHGKAHGILPASQSPAETSRPTAAERALRI